MAYLLKEDIMSKCVGCGVELQNTNKEEIGYTTNLENNLCERCFRIRNYNEYSKVLKDNEDYINILKNINSNDLVVLVVDLFNFNNLEEISKYLNNDILLVLTKRDLLPKSCYNEKILNYFDNLNLNIKDKVIISSKKNYNMDLLFNKINELKKDKNVYVVGFTNSGKSTLINKLIYNYSDNDIIITTSNLPSTTIDSIEIKVNDNLILIDTPGLLNKGDIIDYVDKEMLKKIIPNKEIRPITYQISKKCSIYVENILRLDLENVNFTMYVSNNLKIEKKFKDQETKLTKKEIEVKKDEDLVIQGLTFISFSSDVKLNIYTIEGVNIYTRKKFI